MSYLLDTNVISELRKGARCDAGVAAWFSSVDERDLYSSVLVIGELRRGIEGLRRKDGGQAVALERWLRELVQGYADRILLVDREVAETWGRLGVPNPIPVVDGLLAATAHVHGLTLVTRNVAHVAPTGVACTNPFARSD